MIHQQLCNTTISFQELADLVQPEDIKTLSLVNVKISGDDDGLLDLAVAVRGHFGLVAVYLENIRFTQQDLKLDLFVEMLEEANSLTVKPKFYHSLRANCTTKLFDHMNDLFDVKLPYRREVLFPARAGKLLVEKGWLTHDLPYHAWADA